MIFKTILNRRYLAAASCAFGAFTFWVGSDTLIKLSGGTLSITQQIVINLSIALLIFLAVSFRGRGLRELKTRKPLFHFIRGLACFATAFAGYYGIIHLPLANFYAIAFTLPFLVALMSSVFLKEKVGVGIWAAILIGFGGVVIAVNVHDYNASAWPWKAIICMLISNLSAAIYAVTIKGGGQNESTTSLVFYPDLIAVIICLGIMTATNDWPGNNEGLLYMVLAGVFNGFGTLLYTAAYRITHKNALVAPFHYTQIITGALCGYLIWNDVPTLNLIIGVIVIIASGLYVIKRRADEPEEIIAKTEVIP